MRWIAHAGLAAGRPGGTATRQRLEFACHVGAAMIEIDVCVTRDGVLVARHDDRAPSGRAVSELGYAELRLAHPVVLTLEERLAELRLQPLHRAAERRGADVTGACRATEVKGARELYELSERVILPHVAVCAM